MKKNNYILLFLFLLLSNCSVHKETKSKMLLYYGKTRCLGKCPVFDMYINENGSVFYEGFENVSIVGKKEFKLTSEEISFLKEELNKIPFSLKEKIKRDIPYTILKYKGKKIRTQNKDNLKILLDFLEKVTP